MERGIKTVLNVAKEVTTAFDSVRPPPIRPFMSTPDLNSTVTGSSSAPHFYPAHMASGRPGMHYLKLAWSHGQADLVSQGFPTAMAFVDQALERGEGILIQYVSYVFCRMIFSMAAAVSVVFHGPQRWLLL